MTDTRTLQVFLLEGFDDDDVVIRVGDAERWRGTGLSTRYQVGLAKAVDIEVPSRSVDVAVELPKRGIAGRVEVVAPGEQHVRVLIDSAGALEVIASRDALRLA